MKLHELVQLRNLLQEAIDFDSISNEVSKNKTSLAELYKFSSEHYHPLIDELITEQEKINFILLSNRELLQLKLNQINKDINYLTNKFFVENYQLECQFNDYKSVQQYRYLYINSEADELLLNRIRLHSTWEYPALEIGCREGEWTKYLVASDPLYIADNFPEFINKTVGQFTPEYQARLRKYQIVNYKIHRLPVNQFGFIFSFNFFNYLSLDTIKQFLIQAQSWLRPGGTMLFTYNNADMSAAAGLCESYVMTYVPKSMLIPMIESLGFDIVDSKDFEPSTSWVEFRKPGILKTVKAHQALGEIKYR